VLVAPICIVPPAPVTVRVMPFCSPSMNDSLSVVMPSELSVTITSTAELLSGGVALKVTAGEAEAVTGVGVTVHASGMSSVAFSFGIATGFAFSRLAMTNNDTTTAQISFMPKPCAEKSHPASVE
jgi:hypothetical protein